jgi:aspartyl-tRNA synthetase
MEKKLSELSLCTLYEVGDLSVSLCGPKLRVRGFVLKLVCTGRHIFISLRDDGETVQCVASRPMDGREDVFTREEYNRLKKVSHESFVELAGTLRRAEEEVRGCTRQDVELHISSFSVLGQASQKLPFAIKDASRTLAERRENPELPTVAYNICIDNRALDMRVPHSRAIFRIVDGVMFYFRSFLRKRGFVEIKTPKLIESSSEGGAKPFSVDFFERKAYLAQSPQLYKQMAVIGGMKRVYEIGHVYRAEKSNINRYLSEFVGLDIEMEIATSYIDLIKLIHALFVEIFDGLKREYPRELETVREAFGFEDVVYKKEPVILTHRECVDMLRREGAEICCSDDFSNQNELRLGKMVREKYDVDMFVIRDYPAAIRPFYTYREEGSGMTRSFDFILRGEEILSGAQRIHDHEELTKCVAEKGISISSLEGYLNAFKLGAPPHGGCGIGLERVLKAYFKLPDIRYFSLFPRDPDRLNP